MTLLSQIEKNSTFKAAIQKKYVEPNALEEFSKNLKENGRTIATLNGSFDLLHPGHLEMLYQAKQQADLLLVLLNTDASIQAYKNPNRPLNPLEVRLQNIAALEMVDCVSWFVETDPCQVLEKIRPDVHVNGGEYGEDCIEGPIVKKHGGRLHIVKLIDGYSTTNLINKIRKTCD
ncbi:MAG: adenylyltransferase/cytidyltransferase family protein [Simkaniaceae bacterium]|nr:adenylyltransferase/cytidyltransferase family protein [Candidatus Sacchlamyda saccharinae]